MTVLIRGHPDPRLTTPANLGEAPGPWQYIGQAGKI